MPSFNEMIWCELTSVSQVTLPHHSVKNDCYIKQFVCLFVCFPLNEAEEYVGLLIRRYGSANAIANSYIFLLVMETSEKTQTAQILWDSRLLCQSWFRKPVSRKHVVHLVLMKKIKSQGTGSTVWARGRCEWFGFLHIPKENFFLVHIERFYGNTLMFSH